MTIIIVLIDNTSQVLGIFINYIAIHNIAISLGYQLRPISSPTSDVCIVYNFRKETYNGYRYVYRSEDGLSVRRNR